MAQIDLRKLALRMKLMEMIRIYAQRRMLQDASIYWRRLILPN